MTTRWKSIIGGAAATTAVAVSALALAVSGQHPAAATAPPSTDPAPEAHGEGTITVSGSGVVRVDPDTATINLGVQANAATGAEAMDDVDVSSSALVEALVAAGIAEEDIQTSGLSLWSTTDDRGEVNGYQASLNVDVVVRDITAVGSTIDAAQQASGPGFTIGGVSFSFADPESVLEQARVDAVADARRTAEQYAAAAGVTLGDVVSLTENAASSPLRYEGELARADAAGPAISPGQLDLTVDISVTFSTAS